MTLTTYWIIKLLLNIYYTFYAIKINKENYDLNSFMDNFSLYAKDLDLKATVLISADQTLDYGVVMSVLAAVKQAGFSDVSLATNG